MFTRDEPTPETITAVDALDVRFPTSRRLDGSDAINPEPDYSAAYVTIRTSHDAIARTMIGNLAIHASGPGQQVRELSGGNQQKVVMARALAIAPKLLVLITPTAGVDVRSKEFLLAKVRETAAGGTGVLIASDELDDLRICDRVLVMFRGRITAELERDWHDHALVAAVEGVEADV